MKKEVLSVVLLAILFAPLVSAGVGISWDKQTALVPEHTETCLTYGVYNPWPDESYVKVEVSEDLQDILQVMDVSIEKVPAFTASTESLPVTFCFQTPEVYEKDCLAFGLLCKQDCTEDMKIYSGEVEVVEVSQSEFESGRGSGGSTTTMSISAPLTVKVQCIVYERNYTIVYLLVGGIAIILLVWRILSKRKKALNANFSKKRKSGKRK